MYKALYLYSNKTGIKRSKKFQDKIIYKLSESFDLVAKETSSQDEFVKECQNCSGDFDVLIVAGGDGTFNLAVSTLCNLDKNRRPILGYLPTGTINDAGKGFGVKGSIRKAINILRKQKIVDIDICKANNQYFSYVCTTGAYADISYVTKRRKKKFFGKLSYYFVAVKEAFIKRKVECSITADGVTYDVVTPFVLVMNGPYVGGFKVNSKNAMFDGVIDIYLTKPGIFNGLLHYLFFKVKTKHIRARKIEITTNQENYWCFDGEKGISGNLKIEVLPGYLKVFGLKKTAKIK